MKPENVVCELIENFDHVANTVSQKKAILRAVSYLAQVEYFREKQDPYQYNRNRCGICGVPWLSGEGKHESISPDCPGVPYTGNIM